MPLYAYKAVDGQGRVARGRMEAANENELAHRLRETSLELIAATAKREASVVLSLAPRRRAVPPRQLAAFYARQGDLLAAGISFVEALRDVASLTEHKALRRALCDIAQAIAHGGGIADSFAARPDLFSPIVLSMIAAGERGGEMTASFAALARYAEARAATQERLSRALRYPLFLFAVAGLAIAFLLIQVVPQVAQFLTGLNGDLPLTTRSLLAFSTFLSGHGGAGFFLLLGLAAACIILYRVHPPTALRLDALALHIPRIGLTLRKAALARFAAAFSLLFRSGCDVVSCLRLARGAVGNRALARAIGDAEARVTSGASLSQALENVLPPFALGLLRLGEKTGDAAKSLDDLATVYDREAQAESDALIAMLEPGLTLLIGALLTWTVIAVLGPLYGSVSILGGRMQ